MLAIVCLLIHNKLKSLLPRNFDIIKKKIYKLIILSKYKNINNKNIFSGKD